MDKTSKQILIDELKKNIASCDLCLKNSCKSRYLVNPFQEYKEYSMLVEPITTNYWSDTYPNLNADIMFIGQDWGSISHLEKYIMNGRKEIGNKTFDNIKEGIEYAGIQEKVILINSVMCLRKGEKISDNDDFDKSFISNCKKFLTKHIEIINPKVIVTLGQTVTRLFIPEAKLSEVASTVIMTNGRMICPIYHLGWKGQSNRRKNSRMSSDFKDDFIEIAQLIQSEKREVKSNGKLSYSV